MAQLDIYQVLSTYYRFVQMEKIMPVPNPKYRYDSKQRPTLDYHLDVYAHIPYPFYRPFCKWKTLGIEIDGKIGHKNTKYQKIKDDLRTDLLYDNFDFHLVRFETEDVFGKGYVNKKTKKLTPVKDKAWILWKLDIKEDEEQI